VGAVGYETGDIFLICSDGLVEGLYDGDILEILRPGHSARNGADLAHLLVEEALAKDGSDNTTALVIQVM
jgi:protein phosphatase